MRVRTNGRAARAGRGAVPLALLVMGLIIPPAALAQEETEECRCERHPRMRVFVPDSGWLRLEAMDSLGERLRMEAPRLIRFFGDDGGWLGVQVATGDDQDDRGVRITRVVPDGPAHEAGLREGDQVLALDGTSLLERLPGEREPRGGEGQWPPSLRLFRMMEDVEPGDTVEVRILREGEERSVQVVAGRRDGGLRMAARMASPEIRGRLEALGERARVAPRLRAFEHDRMRFNAGSPRFWIAGLSLRATDLNAGLAEYFGATEGALILETDQAADLDLRAGDVVVAIGERPVGDVSDLLRILRSYKAGEAIRLDVLRRNERVTVSGTLPR